MKRLLVLLLFITVPAGAEDPAKTCRRKKGDPAACVEAAKAEKNRPAAERLLAIGCRKKHQPACELLATMKAEDKKAKQKEKERKACLAECERRGMYTECADEDGNLTSCGCHCP